MALEKFTNNATTTLNGGINSAVTSLVVASAATFPTSGNFRILIGTELMLVTAVSGTTYTVTRGVEGTSAASHSNGDSISHILTAAALAQTIADNKPITNSLALCSADTNFVSGSWTDVTGCSLSLAAGTWLILANIAMQNTSGGNSTGGCKLYYSSTDLIAGQYSLGAGFACVFTLQTIATLSGSQTVKLAGRDQGAGVFQAARYGDSVLGAANIPGTLLSAILLA